MTATIINADARYIPLADGIVQTCVTSPPYYGLRDYGNSAQIGLEQTPAAYVANIVQVMREVRRVLRDDGTLWLNLGDSYAGSGRGSNDHREIDGLGMKPRTSYTGQVRDTSGLKPKDLIGIPWRVAFALQDDGWYLRSDIIWHKPNPMPESVTDRPTKSHEYIFLLTKSPRYYYDAAAILEPAKYDGRKDTVMKGSAKYNNGFVPDQSAQTLAVRGHERWPKRLYPNGANQTLHDYKHSGYFKADGTPLFQTNGDGEPARNKRSVWIVPTAQYANAHFATFPEALIEPCILAGSKAGDLVIDPFCGSGTTGAVAIEHGRHFVGLDLNSEYIALAHERISGITPRLFV